MLKTHRWARVISGLAAIGVLAVAVAPASAGPPSGPGPGNAPNAKACQKGGWDGLVRADGSRFTSESACTSYAAEGGTLFYLREVPCLNGGYTSVFTSTGASFNTQDECVQYLRADINNTLYNASERPCLGGGHTSVFSSSGGSFSDQAACLTYVHNGGTLFSATEAPCLGGGYANVVTSTGESFSDQAACLTYVRNGGTLKQKPTEPPKTKQDCVDALEAAGIDAPDPEDPNYNYIVGTDGDDILLPTAGNDVICGFAGNDQTPKDGNTWRQDVQQGDIFHGGAGDDTVAHSVYGTFIGGDGSDSISVPSGVLWSGGTFNGGPGDDSVYYVWGGAFNGGSGCDSVGHYIDGTVNLGDETGC